MSVTKVELEKRIGQLEHQVGQWKLDKEELIRLRFERDKRAEELRGVHLKLAVAQAQAMEAQGNLLELHLSLIHI